MEGKKDVATSWTAQLENDAAAVKSISERVKLSKGLQQRDVENYLSGYIAEKIGNTRLNLKAEPKSKVRATNVNKKRGVPKLPKQGCDLKCPDKKGKNKPKSKQLSPARAAGNEYGGSSSFGHRVDDNRPKRPIVDYTGYEIFSDDVINDTF